MESGYDLEARKFEFGEKETSSNNMVKVCGILQSFGGAFLSKQTYLRDELSDTLDSGYVLKKDGSVAMMVAAKGDVILESALSSNDVSFRASQPNAKEWDVSILTADETNNCMGDVNWVLPSSDVVAVTVDAHSLQEHKILMDSECYGLWRRTVSTAMSCTGSIENSD